ncbi:MAG TPA: tetratricopeptide repeat protein, partial [Steroidobacteraceae bacterium]|nr:tetratricopeptide repeat protein [Steroidobacteraceae bacterium]
MNATLTDPEVPASPSASELEMRRVRDLAKAGQHAPALEAAQALVAKEPENRDALHLVALSQRLLGRIADALATLERLERIHPGYSRLCQERGHCYVALRDAPRAIEAF